MAKNKNKGQPRNYTLESGVARFGKSATYHKKAIYKFLKKKTAKKPSGVKPAFIKKEIGGAKNGGSRMVRVRKLANNYPTQDKPVEKGIKQYFSKHVRRVRPTITPGVVAIILAGVHKGKRVVVLKQLPTGLILVTGPFSINGCPVRRINQRFLIATSTKIDISSVKVPEKLNDDYFRRIKAGKKQAKKEGDIFDATKKEYKPSEERKTDQKALDKDVLQAIAKHPEGKALKAYLRHNFALTKGQYPHKMTF